MNLHPDHLAELKKSGLTDATIEAAGIYTVPPSQINKVMGRNAPITSLLAFPYDGTGFERYKLFPSLKDADGQEKKYHQPKGSPVRLYVPPGFACWNSKWRIAEGEKKALKGTQEGLNVLGLGGIWNFAFKDDNDVPMLIDELRDVPWQTKNVEIIPDGDFKRKEEVAHAVFRMASMLEACGADVAVVVLPGDAKLDSYLMENGVTAFLQLPRIDRNADFFQEAKVSEENRWPAPLDEAAYYGIAGEYVRILDPQTESDPAAILYQFLVAFGNVVGRAPYFIVEVDRHHTNEFLLLVGETAKGRKGISFGRATNVISEIDRDWAGERIKGGLVSGEGLIYNVRDAMKDDEGVSDKRLLVFEPEFASVLRIIERRENILSATLRQAWDTGHLRTLAKNTPVKASNAHISLVSHITGDELKRRMSETEVFNGFANRFLFICVRRSKLLPEGGNLQALDLSCITQKLNKAVEFSQTVGELRRDEEARTIWKEVYRHLTRDIPGLLGALTSRAEAHVLRLSMMYALLDCSEFIRAPHLLAALALWEYVESSAKFIFGEMTGDPVADKIYQAAWRSEDEGITRTFINSVLFRRNLNSKRIEHAIAVLLLACKIRVENIETGGRQETRIYAVR